ncbi:MAG: hypothetical protein MI751_12695, partial [Pseudomonadales bacterium]|nr:hypothetical protein [Pseudomonadales bacterium]
MLSRVLLAVALWLVGILPAYAGTAAAFYYGPDIPWSRLALYDYPVVEPDQADGVPSSVSDQRFYAYVSLGEVLPQR